MDVITISSDSEASLNTSDISLKNTSFNYLDEINVEWNDDDDDRPAINYSLKLPENEVDQHMNSDDEIKEISTPIKLSQEDMFSNHITVSDKKTLSYECILDSLKLSSETKPCNEINNTNLDKPKRRQKLSQEDKEKEKILKEQKKIEKDKLREIKKAELQKQKVLKAAFFENQRNLKPENNIKFLKVHIDNDIINSVFGGNVISLLQENNIQYVVEPQIKNFTVTWSKKRVQKIVDDLGELTDSIDISEENILLYVLDWEKAVNLIHTNELLSHVETVRSAYIDKKLILIIYGIEKYFNYKKNKINHEIKAIINDKKMAKPKSGKRVLEEAPNITRDQLEFALTDLQLLGKINCRLLETSEEFSSLILNFTKSLSHIDLKLEKLKRKKTDFVWIATDSHRQSVKVDKNGDGLLRLWQQQICQFSSVGLETAQAVVSHYNSPLALVNQYGNIKSIKEGELLLQNIQIRREAGLLSNSRRVGPQLSKKIYKFFTSDDPDLELY